MDETLPKKKQKAPKNNKITFYMKELLALLFTMVGVLTSEILLGHLKSKKVILADLSIDWFSIFVASLVSLLIYGATHSQIEYKEDMKEVNLITKLTTAFSQGVMAKTVLFGMTN